ncbi:MAG: MtrB/PioB family outer membrane beta-barrel protein [Deltaproteobacteria bacterium]|nr:MtrB/PioB family outer membrane beta-barrel protein [Deltaproteobacteria bacterium]
MKKYRFSTLRALPAALILLSLPSGAPWLAEEETFRLSLDSISFGFLETDVTTDSAKFQEYRDIGSGFQLTDLRLRGIGANGDRVLTLTADNVGRDDARYGFSYGMSGKYSLEIDYNKIPHRFGNNATLLWNRTGPGTWAISDAVQSQIQGALEDRFALDRSGVNFPFLSAVLAPHLSAANKSDLGLQRDRTRVTLELGKLGHLAWTAEVRHENRDGLRPFGGDFGFNNAQEIPEPIDYDTTDAEVRGEWNGAKGGVNFGYRYSTFENDISTLVWDNPFRGSDSTDPRAYLGPGFLSINGPTQGLVDLAPDNEANLAFVSGRTKLGAGWWLNGTLNYNVMTQNDPLLPYTLNSAIQGIDHETGTTFDAADPNNLPVRNADNEVEVLSLAGNAGTRFGDDWKLTFRYRYYDYDNTSPRIEFPGYVRMHSTWQEVPRITVPYSYTRDDLGAEVAWEATSKTTLALSYRLLSWDREFRETESTDEDILELTLDQRLSSKATLRAGWETGTRSNDGYEVEAQELTFLEPEGINNQPGLRKFTQAARDFDDYDLSLNLFPTPEWNVIFGYSGRNEDYPDSQFGLIADDIQQLNFEIGYTPGAGFGCYLFGHRADRDVLQRARQSGGTLSTDPRNDWQADLEETIDTWGFGINGERDHWFWDASARWSNSDGEADFFTPAGGSPSSAVDFDNYEDIELLAFHLKVRYDIRDGASVGLSYLFEDYTIDSFILQGLQPYLPSALQLAASNGSYEGNVIGLHLKFAF